MPRKKGTPKTGGRDFKPGAEWTGNAGGMPKFKPFRDAYQKLAVTSGSELRNLDPSKLTGAELVALAIMREGIKGKAPAAQEAADRAEGKVRQEVELGGPGSFDEEELDQKIAELLSLSPVPMAKR